MATARDVATGAARGVAESVGSAGAQGVKNFLQGKFDQVMERMAADLLSAKGTLDDSAATLILEAYRERDREKHRKLLELQSHLNKPQLDDFRVVSIGVVFLTSQTGSKQGKSPEVEGKAQGNPLLLGIDFTSDASFAKLFEIYDHLVEDFDALAEKNQETVKSLLLDSALYGNETVKKRLAGALTSVTDWPIVMKRWTMKGWGAMLAGLDSLEPTGAILANGAKAFEGRGQAFLTTQQAVRPATEPLVQQPVISATKRHWPWVALAIVFLGLMVVVIVSC